MLQNYTIVVTLCVKVKCDRLNLSLYSAFCCRGFLSSYIVFQKRPPICYPSVFFVCIPSPTFCNRPMVFYVPIFVLFVLTFACFSSIDGLSSKNDGSLLHKRRVVFYQRSITAIILLMNRKWSIEYLCVKKSIFLPLSRAHAHTHYRSFRFFAVTSVTDDL